VPFAAIFHWHDQGKQECTSHVDDQPNSKVKWRIGEELHPGNTLKVTPLWREGTGTSQRYLPWVLNLTLRFLPHHHLDHDAGLQGKNAPLSILNRSQVPLRRAEIDPFLSTLCSGDNYLLTKG
jgi:hypothetical protein